MSVRPEEKQIFCGLLVASGLFMAFLGTYAEAYYAPIVSIAVTAALLWTGRAPRLLKLVLIANQVTSVLLILAIFYRRAVQPTEVITLDIASLALIGNMLLGGPLLTVLSAALFMRQARGGAAPAWLAELSA